MTVALRPLLATGRCATSGCSLPAQPGRDECSECIRSRIVSGEPAKVPGKTRRCLDCPAEIDAGRNGQRVRCTGCSRKADNRRKKQAARLKAAKRAAPETDELLAKMKPAGMDGFRGRVARAYRFPEGAKK